MPTLRPFLYGLAATVAVGFVVVVAFGAEAIWLFGLLALTAAATAVGIAAGGDLVTDWSRRRFDER